MLYLDGPFLLTDANLQALCDKVSSQAVMTASAVHAEARVAEQAKMAEE